MGAKAKAIRAASAIGQAVALGPLAALTIPASDAILSHAEEKWDEKKEKERRERKND